MRATFELERPRGARSPHPRLAATVGVAALTALYVLGVVFLTGVAYAHPTLAATQSSIAPYLSTATHLPTAVGSPSGAIKGADSSGENETGENETGENETAENDTGEGDQGGNVTVCENDQGENESDDNQTDSSPITFDGSNSNETDDQGNNATNCSGDPPVTFKALGLPSGSTWSVSAGSPAVTQTNTTVGHVGKIVFDVSNGTLTYTITPPAGFGVAKIVGPGIPSQTSDNISWATVLTVKFSAFQHLSFVEKGLAAGSVWAVKIWSSLPHGGPAAQSGSNTTTASGGVISFTVVHGSWKFNVTEVPTNYTVHPHHGSVGVAGHAVMKLLRFHLMVTSPASPVAAPASIGAVLTRLAAAKP
jgi:hypothetical protein